MRGALFWPPKLSLTYTDSRMFRLGFGKILPWFPILGSAIEIIQTAPGSDLTLGNGFDLHWRSSYFEVTHGNTSIWSTVSTVRMIQSQDTSDQTQGHLRLPKDQLGQNSAYSPIG
jgi:hypothetical protein